MKITRIDCHVLVEPAYDTTATSSSQDDIVVEIHTDEGLVGIGETDVNPWIARACIQAPGTHSMGLGLSEMLEGADPFEEGLWERLYAGSAMNGRRGAVIHALGALDIALHDLRGKALGVPCYELAGGARRTHVTPYASLQPDASSIAAYTDSLVAWAVRAKTLGFRAVKAEVTLRGPYAHMGLSGTWDDTTQIIAAVRNAVGADFTLMVDVQYGFADAGEFLAVTNDWREFGLYFVETPLPSDDLDGYARIAQEGAVPVAAGEWLATRFEFLQLMSHGRVHVVQPDIGRVGGLTEAMRVCALAEQHSRTVVPHAWKTGISIAAAIQMAAVAPHCAFIEYLPAELCESSLRRELTDDPFQFREGQIALPTTPGLGVSLNREALDRFAARSVPIL